MTTASGTATTTVTSPRMTAPSLVSTRLGDVLAHGQRGPGLGGPGRRHPVRPGGRGLERRHRPAGSAGIEVVAGAGPVGGHRTAAPAGPVTVNAVAAVEITPVERPS